MKSRAFALLAALASVAALAAERHSILHGGERIDIVDRGGLAIWEGDIVLGRTADLVEATRRADLLGAAAFPTGKGAGLGTTGGRWPRGASGLFELAYVVETDPENRVPAAIESFNQLMAGMFRAVPRSTETDYVAFSLTVSDGGITCFSSVGRIGGRQTIGGHRSCSTGVLLHEIGHALGLFHEQQRGDHPGWVSVDLAAVDPSRASNYRAATNQRDVGSYDYGSLMHYAPTAFSKTGVPVMESIPPGIAFGQRAGFSRGDVDALRRLYGLFDAAIVVDTYPSGLSVIVDGARVVTPATFSWPIGSTHTLDVPPGAQMLDGVVHVFGRWSSDAAGTLAARQTITVSPGPGTVVQPTAYPAVSVHTANFVRMKEVRLSASGNRAGAGGSVAADPPPAAVPGLAGTYYRERQQFTLTPTAGSGSAFGRWTGSYSFPTATSTPHATLMRGPLAFSTAVAFYQFNAYFVDYPFATLRARSQDGDIFGISATVTRASGASASQRLPFSTVETASPWAAGESAGVTVPASATPFASSVRYRLVSLGGSSAGTATLVHPSPGEPSTTLVADYNKQYEPFRQVIPSCAGSISLGTQADGWVDAGAMVPVTLTPSAGWVLARWRGSLTGNATSGGFVATDVPDVVAEMNVVPAPLEIAELRPASVTAGTGVALEIAGRGFTATSRVLVAGASKTPSSITDTRIVVPLAGSDFPASGKVVVTVQNRPSEAATCALNVSTTFEVLAGQGAQAVPAHDYSDLWWNAAESGWGLNLIQHASNVVFGVMYTYDANGKPVWYVLPGGSWSSPTQYTGTLYRATGPAYTGAFIPSAVNVRAVGEATLSFAGRDSGTFTFSVDGRQVVKSITRQPF